MEHQTNRLEDHDDDQPEDDQLSKAAGSETAGDDACWTGVTVWFHQDRQACRLCCARLQFAQAVRYFIGETEQLVEE